jgi:hypothetical protein
MPPKPLNQGSFSGDFSHRPNFCPKFLKRLRNPGLTPFSTHRPVMFFNKFHPAKVINPVLFPRRHAKMKTFKLPQSKWINFSCSLRVEKLFHLKNRGKRQHDEKDHRFFKGIAEAVRILIFFNYMLSWKELLSCLSVGSPFASLIY